MTSLKKRILIASTAAALLAGASLSAFAMGGGDRCDGPGAGYRNDSCLCRPGPDGGKSGWPRSGDQWKPHCGLMAQAALAVC